ncbi:MAG: suppressor of fused domain protein [Bacteroidales bacterium]|nr:suppressor of fused domain protein [Bacteroidales bacterium]
MEKSKSGAPIYRYDDHKPKDFELAIGESSMEEITGHIEKHVGQIDLVYHEIISDKVHVDIHCINPTPELPFYKLITTGMSDKPMNTPPDVQDCEYAELCICLPQNWKLTEEDFKNENYYWPLRSLKFLAHFPHEYDTWLGWGHTIPYGNPPAPFADNNNFNTIALLPPIEFGEEFPQLKLENKTINFFSLIPLYQEEVQLKLDKGIEALFDDFEKHNVTDVIDINRPNVALRKKKRFGLF